MKPQTLSRVERLQLVNQYGILEKIDPKDAEHWANCKEIVLEGFTMFYSTLFDSIVDELSFEECRYVFDVLGMYDALQQSFARLGDKGDISEDNVTFHGFYGNEEIKHLSFTRYLYKQGQWKTVLKNEDLDSHMPTKWQYPPMLEEWKSIGDVMRMHNLTKDDIRAILDAPRKQNEGQR